MSGTDGDWKPRLRIDVLRSDGDDGQAILLDTLVVRKVTLGPLSSRIQPLFDGGRTVPEILAEAGRLLPDRTPVEIERIVRQFLALVLVEGSGDAIVARAADMKTGTAAYPAIVLDGARWSCLACGQCCRVYALGPLQGEDIQRLLERGVPDHFPHIPDAKFFFAQQPDEAPPSTFIRTTEGECIFLDAQGQCGVHARLGEAMKPGFCRTYPLLAAATIDGWKLYDNGECSRFAEAYLEGKPLAERTAEARAWLPDDLNIHHPVVFLDDDTPYDHGFHLRMQRRLCDILREQAPDATTALVWAGRTARRFAEALHTFPLRPGEPDATIDAALGGDPDRLVPFVGAAEEPSERFVTLATIAKELMDVAAASLGKGPVHPLGGEPPPAHDFVSVMHCLIGTAIGRSGGTPTPVPRVPVGDGPREQDRILRYTLRQQVFGHLALIDDRLPPALLRLAFSHLATVLGARLSAAREGSPAVELRHLSRGHMVAQWSLRPGRVGEVLRRHEDAVWQVLETVPWLL
jgi:Fe-S-cluster containining protein